MCIFIPINVGEADWLKAASVALLLHLIGFDGILLSAKRGESNRREWWEWRMGSTFFYFFLFFPNTPQLAVWVCHVAPLWACRIFNLQKGRVKKNEVYKKPSLWFLMIPAFLVGGFLYYMEYRGAGIVIFLSVFSLYLLPEMLFSKNES